MARFDDLFGPGSLRKAWSSAASKKRKPNSKAANSQNGAKAASTSGPNKQGLPNAAKAASKRGDDAINRKANRNSNKNSEPEIEGQCALQKSKAQPVKTGGNNTTNAAQVKPKQAAVDPKRVKQNGDILKLQKQNIDLKKEVSTLKQKISGAETEWKKLRAENRFNELENKYKRLDRLTTEHVRLLMKKMRLQSELLTNVAIGGKIDTALSNDEKEICKEYLRLVRSYPCVKQGPANTKTAKK